MITLAVSLTYVICNLRKLFISSSKIRRGKMRACTNKKKTTNNKKKKRRKDKTGKADRVFAKLRLIKQQIRLYAFFNVSYTCYNDSNFT